MIWGCVSVHDMANLHICEGTVDAESFGATCAVIQTDVNAYFSRLILHVSQQGFIVKEFRY